MRCPETIRVVMLRPSQAGATLSGRRTTVRSQDAATIRPSTRAWADMRFDGSVIVVTGAAGGIGLALAQDAVRRELGVAIPDVREDGLAVARDRLEATGGDVPAVRADMTGSADLQALAASVTRFGRVSVLVNKAAAFVASPARETPGAQPDRPIGLNPGSVAHGQRAFVPRTVAQGDLCGVLNIASAAAIPVHPDHTWPSSSRHAALTAALHGGLAAEGTGTIGLSIAMPDIVRTGIIAPGKASPEAPSLGAEPRPERRTVRAVRQQVFPASTFSRNDRHNATARRKSRPDRKGSR